MSKEELLKIQTCALKVNIHCDGCKQKVKKQLQKIEGVLTAQVDAEQGKVTVTGNVDPSILIKKLRKSGKYAEIWGSKGNSNQSKNQLDNGKGQKDGKSKGGKEQKGQQQPIKPQQMLPQMKGLDLTQLPQFKFPFKDQKSVKFDIPDDFGEDYEGSEDFDYDDEYDDDEDGLYDDEFDEEELMKKLKGMNGFGGVGLNGQQIPFTNDKKGGGKAGGDVQVPGKGGGGGNNDGKNGNGGKKGGGGGNNGGNQAQGGAQKNGAKNGGPQEQNKNGNGNNKNANGGNNGSGGGGKKGGGGGGGKNDLRQPMHNMAQAYPGMDMGGEPRNVAQMGNIPIAQMANFQAVQGMPAPAMNAGGYFQGAGPEIVAGNPYYQQQLAAMMMQQQQRQNGNERFHPMMYARPPPVSYMHPPQPYTSYFSDENANGCSVM